MDIAGKCSWYQFQQNDFSSINSIDERRCPFSCPQSFMFNLDLSSNSIMIIAKRVS